MKKGEGTLVYGCSDDLLEFDGDVRGEVGCYDVKPEKPLTVTFSDGTKIEAFYEKNELAVWGIKVLKKGKLFDRIEECDDEDADPYSDQLFFKPGLKWAKHSRNGRTPVLVD